MGVRRDKIGERLFLVDGSALAHRSFHAFQGYRRLTSRGKDVSMVFGFLNTILSLIRKEKPDKLEIAFDTSVPTFRHKIYDQYKANRPPIDETLREQIPLIYELLDALCLPRIAKEGYEADDIIGTLAQKGAQEEMDVYIVAGDKDFFQLVNERIHIYRLPIGRSTEAPEILDREGVYRKFGVYPEQVVDTLSLMGDSSDNVPGIPKVGEKTAVELIRQFRSLEEVFRQANLIEKPTLRQSLLENRDLALMSRKLVTIDTQVPLEISLDELSYGPLNNTLSRRKLLEWEFASILKQVEELEPEIRPHPREIKGRQLIMSDQEKLPVQEQILPEEQLRTSKRDYRLVTNAEALQEVIRQLQEAQWFAVDTETTSLDPMMAELVGISFSCQIGEGWYIPVNHFNGIPESYHPKISPPIWNSSSREALFILEMLKPILEDETIKKVGQNLKYDLLVLKCYGIDVKGVEFDTMLASYVLDPTSRQHGIDFMAEKFLGIPKTPTSQLIGSGPRQGSMADVPIEQICDYACEDADVALRLTLYFRDKIKEADQEALFYQLEMPLIPVLVQMEYNGVKLDTDYLKEISHEFQRELDRLEEEIYEVAGTRFNINSTQQLAEVLYDRLRLPKGRKTKLGYSTDNEELERLREIAPDSKIPDLLLRYRHFAKLKSTYVDALPQAINPRTGRVHTSYSQISAATGRLVSSEPNLQNIPVRSEDGGRIRRAFIPGEENWVILSADYSQIELRIMAHLSQDERLITAFQKGLDIHRATAAWMNNISPDQVTPEMRRQAKEVNFGVLYGMGEYGLSQRLNISRARAKEFIELYFSQFSRVKQFIDEILQEAREKGYVKTIMGRKRPLPDILNKNFHIRSNAERIAINTPIQGSAADLMKKAMISVHQMLNDERFHAKIIMQVHDELVFEVPEDEVERLSGRLKEVMSNAMNLTVPLEVGIGVGPNWLEAHD